MAWLLIGADGEIVVGPAQEQPAAADGQQLVETVLGYPESMAWDPASRGFVDIAPPATPLAALIALLVAKGAITALEAEGIGA